MDLRGTRLAAGRGAKALGLVSLAHPCRVRRAGCGRSLGRVAGERFGCPRGDLSRRQLARRAAARRPPPGCRRDRASNGARALIRGWNRHGWIDLPHRVGDQDRAPDRRRPRRGDGATDSTSVNLFKLLALALRAAARNAACPDRARQLPDRPLHRRGARRAARRAATRCAPSTPMRSRTRSMRTVAVLMLTHVDYRTGAHARHGAPDRGGPRRRCAGALGPGARAGAVPVDAQRRRRRSRGRLRLQISQRRARGPGLPVRAPSAGTTQARQPLSGWMGHAGAVRVRRPITGPAAGIARLLSGTPPILACRRSRTASTCCSRPTSSAAAQVAAALRGVHRAGRAAMRGPRLRPREPARARAARQPGHLPPPGGLRRSCRR